MTEIYLFLQIFISILRRTLMDIGSAVFHRLLVWSSKPFIVAVLRVGE